MQGPRSKPGSMRRPAHAGAAGFRAQERRRGRSAESRRETPKGERLRRPRVSRRRIARRGACRRWSRRAESRLPIPKVMRWGGGEAAVRAPGARPRHAARLAHGSGHGARPRKPATRRRAIVSCASGAITLARADEYESAAAGRRQRHRRLRRAHARRSRSALAEQAAGEAPTSATTTRCSTKSRRWWRRRRVRGQVRRRVPRGAAGMPDPLHEAAPEILSAARRARESCCRASSSCPTSRATDPREIIHGNERVLRARLADAKFFYDQDRKTRLEARVPQLARSSTTTSSAPSSSAWSASQLLAGRYRAAARSRRGTRQSAPRCLAKADLLTEMVGEFPELQGIMGRYYALHDGEPRVVADAIGRTTGRALRAMCCRTIPSRARSRSPTSSTRSPDSSASASSRPATGIRSRCAAPRSAWCASSSSSKLPLLAVRAGSQRGTDVQCVHLRALRGLPEGARLLRRCRSTRCSAAVRRARLVPQQLEAVKAFQALPEAESLAAANKRVANILKQAEAKGESFNGRAQS